MRRWALSLGFHEALESIALVLERECMLSSSSTPPEAQIQLTHAAAQIRNTSFPFSRAIVPASTKH